MSETRTPVVPFNPLGLTLEDAFRLAAEAADPDFLEKYAAMQRRMAELEARLADDA